MTIPIDEFLETYGSPETEKTANQTAFGFAQNPGRLAQFGQNFGKAMVGGLGAGAATAAVGIGAMAAKSIMSAATKSRDFRAMLENNEDLGAHHANDPRRFNQLYTSLHTMNPAFAQDPIVAGTYMRQMLENPMNAGGILAQTIGTRGAFPSVMDRAELDASSAAKSHFSRQSKPRSE